MALHYSKTVCVLLFLFLGGVSSADVSVPETLGDGIFGAEIELSAKHLYRLVDKVDFAELQSRMKDFSLSMAAQQMRSVTQDLPLTMHNFLELMPADVREYLTKDLTDTGVAPEMTLLRSNGLPFKASEIKSDKTIEAPRIWLGDTNQANPAPPKVENRKIEFKEQLNSNETLKSYFWKTVNQRWDQISPLDRLFMIPWEKLPSSSKAALIVYLYSVKTSKIYGPETPGFRPDALDMKFSDAYLNEVYGKFYPAKDRDGIVEYHTLEPKTHLAFFNELKSFLGYLGIARPVLQRKTNKFIDIGLHIHFSSPHLAKFDLDEFTLDYKRMMTLRALGQGDLSVLIPAQFLETEIGRISIEDYSYKPSSENRDLIALRHGSKAGRLEVRYFTDDVESEMKELDSVSKMAVKDAKRYTLAESAKVVTGPMLSMVLKWQPSYFFNLLPLETWGHLRLSEKERSQVQEHFNKGYVNLLRPVQSALQNGTVISEDQRAIIETALYFRLSAGAENVNTYSQIVRLANLGFKFQAELKEFNRENKNFKPFQDRLEVLIKTNLAQYSKRVHEAIEDMMEERRGRLEERAPIENLLLFELIKDSVTQVTLREQVLKVLRQPEVVEQLKKNYAIDHMLPYFFNHSKDFESGYLRAILSLLIGPDKSKQPLYFARRVRSFSNEEAKKTFLNKMNINACTFFYMH